MTLLILFPSGFDTLPVFAIESTRERYVDAFKSLKQSHAIEKALLGQRYQKQTKKRRKKSNSLFVWKFLGKVFGKVFGGVYSIIERIRGGTQNKNCKLYGRIQKLINGLDKFVLRSRQENSNFFEEIAKKLFLNPDSKTQ